MEKYYCKYCGAELKKVAMPDDSSWGAEFVMICMNDDCTYYTRGWDWMQVNYKVVSSYRYCINTVNGMEVPIAVHSPSDFKNLIIE